jgi:spore photoproduct lyase
MINTDLLKEKIFARFSFFGVNKQQELSRLVFEIALHEQVTPEAVLLSIPLEQRSFPRIKEAFVRRRFADLTARGILVDESFSMVDIDPANAVLLQPAPSFYPKRVYIEDDAKRSFLTDRAERLFPLAQFLSITSYKEDAKARSLDIKAYNRRTEDLFIVHEKHDFYKKCPCSPGVVGCGYHNVNLGVGCPFECSYCFLQNYTNAHGIVLPANIEDFFAAFKDYDQGVRVGSGELTDSLVFDHITEFSPRIVEFFRSHPKSVFEFKTKSVNIEKLLSVQGVSNIVVSWSLNPQVFIDREEHFTASLKDRLHAANRCARHGYRTAFHFDPIVPFKGWEEEYSKVIDLLFEYVPADSVAWISLGMLRMTQRQKKVIENRFPENTILSGEMLIGEDGKLRYHDSVRRDVYQKMLARLKKKCSKDTYIYLCMEPRSIWDVLKDAF